MIQGNKRKNDGDHSVGRWGSIMRVQRIVCRMKMEWIPDRWDFRNSHVHKVRHAVSLPSYLLTEITLKR